MFDDSFHNGKSYSSPLDLRSRVESPERLENALGITHIESDAVVPDTQYPFIPIRPCRDVNVWLFGTPVLDGIADEVLKHSENSIFIRTDGR